SQHELTWQACKLDDYVLDFNLLLGKTVEHAVAYAVCYIASDAEQKGLVMTISSDDQAKVYLNRKEIYRCAVERILYAAADKVEGIELKAGINVLALKVVNGGEDWQSSVSLTDAAGQPLKGVRITLDPDGK